MLTETLFHDGSSRKDTFDALGRVTSDPEHGDYSAAYTYDAVGNREQSVIDGVTTA